MLKVRKNLLVVMLVLVLLVVCVSCVKAPNIEVPEKEAIISANVSLNGFDKDQPIEIKQDQIEKVVDFIKNAKPTYKKSNDDTPNNEPSYFTVVLKTDEKKYEYYVYENKSSTYVEVPYVGIYKVDESIIQILEKYFEAEIA